MLLKYNPNMKARLPRLLLIVCLVAAGCATSKNSCGPNSCHSPDSPEAYGELVQFKAVVDGSGHIAFTRESARYEHKFWKAPWDVTLNGEPWFNLDQTPAGWTELCRELDLSHAKIVERTGRDVITLETTAEGFDLYLSDTPNGADSYEATIAIPRRR